MKIGFIGTKGINFRNIAFGGFETVVTELAPRLVREGHEVTIYCRKKMYSTKPSLTQINGVNLVFLSSIETKNLGTMTNSFLAVIHAVRHHMDVLFLFNLALGLFIPFVKMFGARIITNLDGLEWERGKWSKLAKIVFKIGAAVNVKYADYLISDSEEIRKIYLTKFKRDSIFIPYGAEIRNDLTDGRIREVGLKPYDYFLLVTRFIPENNALYIIRSFQKANTQRKLVVLGKNYYNSEYERKIKEISDPRILLLGHISDRKLLYEYYHFSYCYVHGHSVGGTNPSMLEALANSCCILALDTKFNQEMLQGGNYGLFFNLSKDDLVSKIEFVDERELLVKEFRNKSKRRILSYYNWESVTSTYIDLIKDLVNNK